MIYCYSLKDVTLDTATLSQKKTNHLTASQIVEVCDCPPEYNSSSCQDPSLGYFRYYNTSVSSTIIIQTVGEARQCECNGRSSVCNVDTGNCKVSDFRLFYRKKLKNKFYRIARITLVVPIAKFVRKGIMETHLQMAVNLVPVRQLQKITPNLVKSILTEN